MDQRRHLAARYHAALTEFWRAHRACARVLHFCGLGYSRTNGQTGDNSIDLKKLKLEPEFQRYMADAFAPVGLMIAEWRAERPGQFPELCHPGTLIVPTWPKSGLAEG